MAQLLRFDQVEISYDGIPVVQDISFSLEEGEILSVVGESGSGKSTLLRAAMGLLGENGLVTRGDIWYQRKNIPDLSEADLRGLRGPELGMVFQHAGSSFCPVRRIGDQLYESMTEHGHKDRRAYEERILQLFQNIGLQDGRAVLESYPFELSGGMQQRVGIAAAMLLHPRILLADEPTSALDVQVQKQVVEELLLLRKTYGTAILLVTHNLGVVRAMADKVLVMRGGRAVEYGNTGQVLENPKSDYTRRLLDAVPRIQR